MSEAPWQEIPMPVKGDRVGFVTRGGELYVGNVTGVEENRETGEVKITLDEPVPKAFNASIPERKDESGED